MADTQEDRQIVYFFSNGFGKEAEKMYGWLNYVRLDPQWADDEFDDRGGRASVITLPVSQVPIFRSLQDSQPSRWGSNPKVWSSRSDGRPDRVPRNGFYWFKAHEGDNYQVCQVTDTRVIFEQSPKGVPHEFLGHAVIFEDIMPPNLLNEQEALVITIDGCPEVFVRRLRGEPLPMLTDILPAYREQYAIHPDSKLSFAFAQQIPMPRIKQEND